MQSYRDRLQHWPHEVIRIDDATSLCEGYNRGAARAGGEILIFCHDDILIVSRDFERKLLDSLSHVDIVGVAGTTRLIGPQWMQARVPHIHGQVLHTKAGQESKPLHVSVYGLSSPLVTGARALDGLFFAAKRGVYEAVRFDERTFDGWHLYDIDFTFRAALDGYRLGVRTDLLIEHQSNGQYDATWQRHAKRFVDKHRAALEPAPTGQPMKAIGLEVQSREEWERLTTALFNSVRSIPPH